MMVQIVCLLDSFVIFRDPDQYCKETLYIFFFLWGGGGGELPAPPPL